MSVKFKPSPEIPSEPFKKICATMVEEKAFHSFGSLFGDNAQMCVCTKSHVSKVYSMGFLSHFLGGFK